MAQSHEERAAKKVIAAIDSLGINPAMLALHVTNEAVNAQQRLLFEFVCALVKHWADSDVLSLHYSPSAEDMERKFLSKAMVEAIEREGYTIW